MASIEVPHGGGRARSAHRVRRLDSDQLRKSIALACAIGAAIIVITVLFVAVLSALSG
jgi:hypothetical protein